MDDTEMDDMNPLDYFAGLAMQALLNFAGSNPSQVRDGLKDSEIASTAYDMAEAMMQERKRRASEPASSRATDSP